MTIKCKICGRTPDEILEYIKAANEENTMPTKYVKMYEGTFNPRTGEFYCTECYIKIKMPLGTA